MEKKRPIIIGAVIAVIVLALAVWFATRDRGTSADPTPQTTTSAPVGAPSTHSSAGGSSASVATSSSCSTLQGPMADPKKFIIERTGVNEPVITVGTEADGAVGAPPKNAARTAAWWKDGPQIGSDAGHAILSIHTYRNGGALGNEMYEGAKKLQVGDVVKVADADGKLTCYKLSDIKKIAAKDYAANPDAYDLFAEGGDPKLVVIICWDFDKASEEWDSRVLFYGDKI